MVEKATFCTAYLPPIAWFQHALQYKQISIEANEHYNKQSYRNRCKILSANGILDLSIPVIHQNKKQFIQEVLTQESEPWRKIHWQAICSAYGKSAFFLYYRDAFENIYLNKDSNHLFGLNLAFIQLIFKLLKVDCEIQITDTYEWQLNMGADFRNSFQAKNPNIDKELLFEKKYYQVFAEKFTFKPNLSIIDLLFNVGPLSKDYLVQAIN
ncbi:MAG: WbqC family protein [Sphingobacteriales bacterium]|jgi:hypothetical protein|nr:WbqC family protein [Sphingobacteriales bacterium]